MKSKCLIVGIMVLLLLNLIAQSMAIVTIERSSMSTRNGKTIYVGGNGSGNYSKIQDAIDNASNGDTVFVYNGTYLELIKINKTINLIGEDKTNTIIKRETSQNKGIIKISASEVTVTGFTCILANIHPCNGIIVTGKNNTISDNIIKDFAGNGGIILRSSYNIISNNILSTDYCLCIEIEKGDYNLIEGNTLMNKNRQGAGIRLLDGADNNIIKNNYIINHSTGIVLYAANNGNIISNNEISYNNQGIWFYISDNNIITENNITNNKKYGVYLFISLKWRLTSDWNKFYCNNFINNSINAYDECTNIWYKFSLGGCIGNFWDDYIGLKFPRLFDLNRDGIGFYPYATSGAKQMFPFFGGVDRFPLMTPYDDTIKGCEIS